MKKTFVLFFIFIFAQSCVESTTELEFEELTVDSDSLTSGTQNLGNLYAKNCQACHRPLVDSSKKESSARSISQAIASVGDMGHLSSLSISDIETIAEELSFSAPTIYSLSPLNGSVFESSQNTIEIQFTTNEVASCRYSLLDKDFSSMSSRFNNSNSFNHTVNIDVSSGVDYKFFIKCEDLYGNTNDRATPLSFSIKGLNAIDTTSPKITEYSPEYGYSYLADTSQAIVSLVTNEASTCRYSSSSSETYANMTTMTTSGATVHSHIFSNLQNAQNYLFYFICADNSLNESMKFSLSFGVDAVSLTGVELYNRKCLNCHNDIKNSTKKFRSTAQIKSAISSISTMQTSELQSLNTSQLDLISAALNVREDTVVENDALATNLILGDRRYLDYVIIHKVFGGADFEDPLRKPWSERDGYWLFKNNGHGGACDVYSNATQPDGSNAFAWEKCSSLYFGSIYANEPTSYTTVRAAYIIRACEANANIASRRAAATASIGGVNTPWSSSNFTTIYQKFFLLEDPAPVVVEKFKELFESQGSTDAGWRAVLVGLCISPEWQVL